MSPSLFRRRRAPRLSVVVPVYDVEAYLPACLDSLEAQTIGELEVVVVDDGSTDGSAAIAASYVDRHPHWTLVRTENRGLGAARNRGVQHASAEYLAFVDSDDVVPTDAYELMVSTLDGSGSDFVVGGVRQLVDGELVEPEFLRAGTARRRVGVRAADVPAITRNVFAWNKVFRRSFYDRAGITFPEGVRYEDQPATMRAYLMADRFDVVARPVYHWRVRGEGTSITQGRARLSDLEDRLATKAMVSQTVRELADPKVRDFWGRLGVVGDLPVYFAQLPVVDDAYWQRLVSGLRDLLDGWSPIEDSELRLPHRLVGWLVVNDRRDDAVRVVSWLEEHPGPLRLRVDGDRVVPVDLPVASEPGVDLPDGARRLGPHELAFDARVVDLSWAGDDLVVSGWAVVRGAPTAGTATEVRARLRDSLGETEVRAEITRFSAPEATAWIARGDQDYADSGFVARFGLADWLSGHEPGDRRSALTLEIEVDVDAVHGAGTARSLGPGLDADRLPSRPGGGRLGWSSEAGLVVHPD